MRADDRVRVRHMIDAGHAIAELIYGYFDIDPALVWKTATEEVPDLLPRLEALAEQA